MDHPLNYGMFRHDCVLRHVKVDRAMLLSFHALLRCYVAQFRGKVSITIGVSPASMVERFEPPMFLETRTQRALSFWLYLLLLACVGSVRIATAFP